MLLALQLPAIVTELVAGSLGDRVRPRLVMELDNALRTLAVGAIRVLYWLGSLEPWLLFALVLCAGALQPFTLVATAVGTGALVGTLSEFSLYGLSRTRLGSVHTA